MGLHIVYLDETTEDVEGVAEVTHVAGHLTMYAADGSVVGEREAVVRTWPT